jgi:hypothetical protein
LRFHGTDAPTRRKRIELAALSTDVAQLQGRTGLEFPEVLHTAPLLDIEQPSTA